MSFDGIEVETGPAPGRAVIWLHGLGSDAHDFEPIVPQLAPKGEPLRFIFPNAPKRPVTLNGGLVMRAWYDLLGIDRRLHEDEDGIRGSYEIITGLIRRENERGIPTSRIVLGGFSQGGSMAVYAGTRYPQALAGIAGLSCYMLLPSSFAEQRSRANQETPFFLAHGKQDPMVPLFMGKETRLILEDSGYRVRWHAYLIGHSVCPEEICDLAAWLRQVLAPQEPAALD